jgi:uncharacterized Fe-S cluster protein YjdI
MDKVYSNVEITIKWQPEKCVHAAVCVGILPEVYNPKASPWIKIESAKIEELKAQISKFSSRALAYYENK